MRRAHQQQHRHCVRAFVDDYLFCISRNTNTHTHKRTTWKSVCGTLFTTCNFPIYLIASFFMFNFSQFYCSANCSMGITHLL